MTAEQIRPDDERAGANIAAAHLYVLRYQQCSAKILRNKLKCFAMSATELIEVLNDQYSDVNICAPEIPDRSSYIFL